MTENADQYWSKLYASGRDYRTISTEAIAKFLSFTDGSRQGICLDIGCGTGQLARELCQEGYETYGIDVSSEAIEIAQSCSPSTSALHYLHFDIEQDDLRTLPRSSYDLITCKLVYAFINDKPGFLERVKTLLAPSGRFVIITPLPADVPPEKKGVAISKGELTLLSQYFRQIALYKHDSLTYFIGTSSLPN